MLGLVLLSLLISLAPPPLDPPSMAMRCREVARSVSGCPRYVLGLSPCEHTHRSVCEMVFRE